ncbi:MAG: dihydrolipoyl dehydrogenase [Dehalococcoidia bacterium]
MVVGQTGSYADVLVIGGGPGGYSAAIRAAQLGRSVTLVERGRIGGVCLNEGCIPSKALLSASRLVSRLRGASTMGIDADPRVDFGRLHAWQEGVVERLSGGVSQLLRRYGVTVLSGTARFVNERRVAVEQGEAFDFVEFGGAVIATGSRAAPPTGIPVDGRHVLTPEQALGLDRLPASLAILGSGSTALELATAYGRLGVSVTVVEAGARLLREIDPMLARAVQTGLRRLGVDLRLEERALAYADGTLQVETKRGMGTIEAEIVIAAEVRLPNREDLSPERAGVRLAEDGRIAVNAQCRSNVWPICAVGDVTPGPPVAQRAIAQGRVAAEVLCGLPSAYDPAVVALAYFTEPEIMSAGLSEVDAQSVGMQTLTARFHFGASGRAATLDEQQGSVQIVAESATRRVLGIHAAGAGVTELAGEAALAIELNATLDDLSLTLHPHPTLSEAIPEAAWLGLDMPLHVFHAR